MSDHPNTVLRFRLCGCADTSCDCFASMEPDHAGDWVKWADHKVLLSPVGAPDSLPERARIFAIGAHGAINQRRKYTNDPYIVHPAEVAAIVTGVPHNDAMHAAAWLHDVVEDCRIPIEVIGALFGPEVCRIVDGLSDVSTLADGPRSARKAIDRAHTAAQAPDVQTVKLADLISNSASIVAHDPKFAKVYLAEKEALLAVLTLGDPALLERAHKQLAAAKAQLAHEKEPKRTNNQ